MNLNAFHYLNEPCCECVDSRSGMCESLMRLKSLSADACDESGGFLWCREIDPAIAIDDEEGGLSLLASLDAILGEICKFLSQ